MALISKHLSRQCHFSVGFELSWSSTNSSPGPGCCQPRIDALSNEITLKFGKRTHEMKDELATWRRRVDLLGQADALDATVLAICGSRMPIEAFENTQSYLLLFAHFEEEEYNRKHSLAHLHKEVMCTVQRILTFIKRLTGLCLRSLHHRFVGWTKPDTTSLLLGTLTDLARSRAELVAENTFLRQQLIILRRQVKRPACTKTDRMLLVLLARAVRTWKHALFIVQPETLLRWHRQGFQLYWKYKRSLFAFFIIDMHSRRVIHMGVHTSPRSPTDAWTAQQLREATPYGQAPKYLICDRDGKFGSCFARVAATSGIEMLKTPYHAPRANAICERFLGSVRRERLDHLFIFQEKQLDRVLQAYVQYFNQVRPHQGIKCQRQPLFGSSWFLVSY